MERNSQTYATFTFTDITNTDPLLSQTNPKTTDLKQKATLLHKSLVKPKPSAVGFRDDLSFQDRLGEALLKSRVQLQGQTGAPEIGWKPVQRERVIRKVNCDFFRGKKAVLKSSNVRISFEITDSL